MRWSPAALLVMTLVGASGVTPAANQPPAERSFAALEASPVPESLSFQRSWQPDITEFGPPEGATAKCRDGHYSFALERHAACSQHRGVEEWIRAL